MTNQINAISHESKLCSKHLKIFWQTIKCQIHLSYWYYSMVSSFVVVPKKNKLYICGDHWKLNTQIRKDTFPLPFLDLVLYIIVGHEMYSFMDGYSEYNKVKMSKNK
jgi:hypothetical protein